MTTSTKGKKCHISHFKVALVFVPAQIHSPHLMRGHRKGLDTKGRRGCTKLIYLGEARQELESHRLPACQCTLGCTLGGESAGKQWVVTLGEQRPTPRLRFRAEPSMEKQGYQRQRERDESLIKKNGQEVKEAR